MEDTLNMEIRKVVVGRVLKFKYQKYASKDSPFAVQGCSDPLACSKAKAGYHGSVAVRRAPAIRTAPACTFDPPP
jgi:hypothetical protein